ncbi:endonuclease [Microbacterium esteraromaticum]|uniref:Holliday junction resolvase RecU n=1 Tax=Mycoplasma wenyonii TaxID=65123 RepID=A0A328PJ82_9MOLU|nr:Holliday junction resolvase RecU [Mycoplasma wenyonii]PYC99637.1 endonuclease [Microbacterium esteraromaticum]RAO95163.1 endonuclease [Mycoplasma wenyonii]
MYQLKNNLGSFVEKIMSNTAEYYIQNNIAYLRKSHPEYIHLSKKAQRHSNLFENEGDTYSMRVCSKGDLDFYGVYKGRYFSFELKETQKPVFALSLVKDHQLEQLKRIDSCGGLAFLLIHFCDNDSRFILLSYPELLKLLELKRAKRFSITDLEKVKSYELKIVFPSVFNLFEQLDQILSDSK